MAGNEQLTIEDCSDIHLEVASSGYRDEIEKLYQDNIERIAKHNYGWADKSPAKISRKVDDLLEKAQSGESIEYLIRNKEGQLIGMTGFYNIDPNSQFAHMSYLVAEDQAGQGFATAAAKRLVQLGFGNLGYQRILLEIDPNNVPSKKIAESLGARPISQVYLVEENGEQFPNQQWEITDDA